ncbi:alpha/beta hydrolase [Dictyobacter kobayashii]|uniref:Esterase n=1 Tax=Dictyobacter kobayashii TaxID=2014872 RepID=A0A402ASU6_9CHLR|nr:alpha/beta hydrolase [Dictyobacter kobayashii]GCE22151.1 esterase [Dictyobacter kobayashii]
MTTGTSKHLVDPEIMGLLDILPPLDLTNETLAQTRAMLSEMNAQLLTGLPEFPDISVREQYIAGPEGAPDVRVLVYLPKNVPTPVPALLWIHGGGYVIGNADQADLQMKSIISATGCAAVAVDYRLAPETPHPGPVEDCYAALKWLYTNASSLGVDASRIAIGGDSAGGGLTACLALLTRDRGEVPLIFQLLIYPMLDDRTVTTADPHPYTGEYVWTPQANHFGWSALLGQEPGGPDVSPYAAAARATNLEGLPPALIGVGTLDLFLEEDIEYARRLIRAGVPTELHIYPGGFHAFPMVAEAKVSQAFIRDYLNALTRAFNQS